MKYKILEICPHQLHHASQKDNPADHPYYAACHQGTDYALETEWEFNTPKEAYDKARELYLEGKKIYGGFRDFIIMETKD